MPSNWTNLGDKQSGDVDILRLKDVNRIRPLDNVVAAWRQHGIEHPSDAEQFASVVCPGPRTCPLDRKPVDAGGNQRFPVSRRFAANVWDYDSGSVKVLVGGPSIFNKFKEAAKIGIDPSTCDWMITKSGQGIKTEYEVVRYDASPLEAPVTPDMLHDVVKYEQPASPEAIFEILEKFGIDYDALEVPTYSYDDALAFRLPFGKHRGETIEQILQADSEYCEWLHGTRLEAGQLGDPIFIALQTAMEEREMVPPLEDALTQMAVNEPPAPAVQTPAPSADRVGSAGGAETAGHPADRSQPQAQAQVPPDSSMVKLINPSGGEAVVPATVVEDMLKAGFKRPESDPPQTSSDANAPTKVLIGGVEVPLPREEALRLIAAGTAQAIEPEPAQPKLPLPDQEVQVSIAGAEVPMPYVQAALVVDNPASGASFVDPAVAQAHTRAKTQEETNRTAAQSPAAPSAPESEPPDPERPFVCNQCPKRFKTQGALTQHLNREHQGTAAPQASAVPAASDGAGVKDRIKQKIQQAPLARDYQTLMRIFQEETGKKNIVDMAEEELLKVEARLDQELARATAA